MYSIYHIEGVKIGVSKNVKRRVKKQGYTMKDVKVLEEHTDIHTVSLREHQLQKEYGYEVDCRLYSDVIKMSKYGATKGGNIRKKMDSNLIAMRTKSNIARRRSLLVYKSDGTFFKEFNSAVDASKELNVRRGCICNVCKGKQKTAKGFVFKYKE